MNQTRILVFISAIFTALTLFFGVGPGHSLIAAQSTHSMPVQEASTQCQSICPPVLNEKYKTPQVDEDDVYPDPFPFLSLVPNQYITALYIIALGVLMLSILQRRPPDLVALYTNYRF